MQANSLPAAQGWQWFIGGLKLWQRNPGVIGLAALLFVLVPSLFGVIPVVGSLLICIAAPFLTVTLLRVCHVVASGRKVLPADLPIRSRQRMRGLVVLGVVTFVVAILGQVLTNLIAGDAMAQLMAANQAALEAMAPTSQSGPLVAGAASAPLANAAPITKPSLPANAIWALLINVTVIALISVVMWIAPALTAFAGVPPVKSLVFSVISCWRNKGAFLVFAVSMLCVCMPLSILVLFGGIGQMLLIMVMFGVLMPACFAGNYVSVTDIFGEALFDSDEAFRG